MDTVALGVQKLLGRHGDLQELRRLSVSRGEGGDVEIEVEIAAADERGAAQTAAGRKHDEHREEGSEEVDSQILAAPVAHMRRPHVSS